MVNGVQHCKVLHPHWTDWWVKKWNPIRACTLSTSNPHERVTSAKYLGELTEDLHGGQHIQAKANKTSAFIYRNHKGCPPQVHSHCYKGLVHPAMLEYASVLCIKILSHSLETVQNCYARRLLKDFNPTTGTSALISKLKLEPLQDRRTICKATFMYTTMSGLVHLNPYKETLTAGNHLSQGQLKRPLIQQSRTDVQLHSFFPTSIRLWNRLPSQALSADTLTASVEDWVWPTM